jgi:integrase
MHRVLREALQQAFDDNVLARNPADSVKPPKVERKEMPVVNVDGAVELIERARGTRLFMPIFLGVQCGMRRQEITALRWRNVNWQDGFISVVMATEQTKKGCREKETKSGKGRRAIELSAAAIEELRSHRARQAEELLSLGVRLTDDHHVVAREDGRPLQPRSLSHAMLKFARPHTRVRLHGLRHSHATHMLGANVHPKIAQERLGHSSIGVTLDLYSHTMPGMQREAMSRVDAALQAALDRKSKC